MGAEPARAAVCRRAGCASGLSRKHGSGGNKRQPMVLRRLSTSLGQLHANGRGGPQDYATARGGTRRPLSRATRGRRLSSGNCMPTGGACRKTLRRHGNGTRRCRRPGQCVGAGSARVVVANGQGVVPQGYRQHKIAVEKERRKVSGLATQHFAAHGGELVHHGRCSQD